MRVFCNIFFILTGFWAPLFAVSIGVAQNQTEDSAMAIKKDYLQQRYQDFFIHLNRAEKLDLERRRGADEIRKRRLEEQKEYEKVRREYVLQKQREKKKEVSAEQYEKEIRAQQEAHERARKDYVRAQRELDRLDSTVGVIPEWVEYELYPKYIVDDKPRAPKSTN